MAKKVKANVRLQIEAGKANPAPPIGPALAAHGINLMAFCKEYNARTSDRMGDIIPADITIFTDGSFKFVLRTSPAAILIKKAAGVEKGSAEPNKEIVGSDYPRSTAGDRSDQDERSECGRYRRCHAPDRRHCPTNGHHNQRLNSRGRMRCHPLRPQGVING